MAVGKQKRVSKGKKGQKKAVDPFVRKEWYEVKAPTVFKNRTVCKTPVTRTTGTKIASEGLKGRVFEACLADLSTNEEDCYRKIRLVAEDVQGKTVLCNFHGLDMTTDKLRSLVRKWQQLIECMVDVKTTDGYTLRCFCIGFTKKAPNQVRKASYAYASQVKQIRDKMIEIIQREAAGQDLKGLFSKMLPEVFGREIEKACHNIYPLHSVFIRKVKIIKKPKFDIGKLLELHGESASSGAKGGAKEFNEPAVQAEV
mmetsp:Transcript_85803/g.266720  ORF Transcript_85803/g.266720 Transcript_85803/m.266720 type:complete len:256 (-) Transcript_85803:69-836(-)